MSADILQSKGDTRDRREPPAARKQEFAAGWNQAELDTAAEADDDVRTSPTLFRMRDLTLVR